MDIETAEFVKGVIGDDYSMGDTLPQVVFLGRSNVGKSSVINTLTGRNKLVHTSTTPGKTREANFFRINDAFYLVDFPGYGYAKMSHKDRDKLVKRILWYLQYSGERPALAVLILDVKVGLTELDMEMLTILHAQGHPILMLVNKVDKLNQSELYKAKLSFEGGLGEGDAVVLFSAKSGLGRDEVLAFIKHNIEK